MTSEELSQIQNPVRLAFLRHKSGRIKKRLMLAALGDITGLHKPSDEHITLLDRAADMAEELDAEAERESTKPKLCKRIFRTPINADTHSVVGRFLFPSACPDHFLRELVRHWGCEIPKDALPLVEEIGMKVEPVHIYRNSRHALVSVRVTCDVEQLKKYAAKKAADKEDV